MDDAVVSILEYLDSVSA